MQEGTCNLNNCFLCSHCITEWREVIGLHKETLIIKKGRQIFKEGEKVKGIFFVYTGAVKVHMHWGDQKELILRFARAGDILGLRGIGSSDLYPISATALEDSKVCFITNEFLETTLKTNPSFTYQLMHFCANELQNAETRMRNLAHMEVKGRVAHALLEISSVFGLNKNKEIAVTLTRQDIASYAGTTYETVFKLFNELTSSEILTTSGKSIRINKPEQLKKLIAEPSF